MVYEVEPQVQARLMDVLARTTSELESITSRILERRYERLLDTHAVTQEALPRLEARSPEAQAMV